MSTQPNTEILSRRAVRRTVARPVQKHRDRNRYVRKDKHQKDWS